MKASSPWSSELERRVKGVFLPPGQMNTWNELEFNFIASLLLRDCCCHRRFVAQLSKVMSVQSFELLRTLKLWLAFVEPELISISERHHVLAWAGYSTDRSEQDALLGMLWRLCRHPLSTDLSGGRKEHWGDKTAFCSLPLKLSRQIPCKFMLHSVRP